MALAGITTMHYSNIQHIWYDNLLFQSSVSLKQSSIQFELLEKMQSKEVVIVYIHEVDNNYIQIIELHNHSVH